MRRVPLAPAASPSRRRLALVDEARPVDRATRPIYAVWEITLRCDLACRHCGSRAGRARPDELSTREALDVVAQLRDLGVREVTLIGGEAYLRDDWTTIARAVRDAGMHCGITTGGRGVTRDVARAARDAGVAGASVSIDGLRETHDALRGVQGSFDAAIAAIGHLRDAGVPVAANTQIHRRNWRDLDAVFDAIVAAGARGWQPQLTVAMGRAADDPDVLLEPHRVIDVVASIAAIAARGRALGVGVRPGNNIGYFGPHEAALRGGGTRASGGTCSAGRLTLGLEANGDVKGCPSLPSAEYVAGNVRDAPLVDIWERGAAMRFTRERPIDELWGRCRGCYYAEACFGGCSWTSHVLFGRRGNNPYCEHRALALRAEGKRERLVKIASGDGAPFDHGRFAIVEEAWTEDA